MLFENIGDEAIRRHIRNKLLAVDDPTALPTCAPVGRFVAVGRTMSYFAAVE